MSEENLQYYASGAIYRIDRLVQGRREGEQVAYYENGQLKTHAHFVDGKLHGTCLLYWPNGQLKREVHFDHGRKVRFDRFWNERGEMTGEYAHE